MNMARFTENPDKNVLREAAKTDLPAMLPRVSRLFVSPVARSIMFRSVNQWRNIVRQLLSPLTVLFIVNQPFRGQPALLINRPAYSARGMNNLTWFKDKGRLTMTSIAVVPFKTERRERIISGLILEALLLSLMVLFPAIKLMGNNPPRGAIQRPVFAIVRMNAAPVTMALINPIPMTLALMNAVPVTLVLMNAVPVAFALINAAPVTTALMVAAPVTIILMNAVPATTVDINEAPVSAVKMNAVPVTTVEMNKVPVTPVVLITPEVPLVFMNMVPLPTTPPFYIFNRPILFIYLFIYPVLHSLVVVTVTLIKVIIKLREKQIALYLVNLLSLKQKEFPGLSGLADIVLITVFTFDIEFTTTTYQYVMST